MTTIYTLAQIKEKTEELDLTEIISKGFIEYSKGRVVVPPVGELNFDDPPGDTHIKYGYIKGDETYVIKIASGFYKNPSLGLNASSGLMLVFSQKTGLLKTILLDEGYLTDIRTAVAGQICAKLLKPRHVKAIGVLGTGIQARMQVELLKPVTTCRKVFVWGPTAANMENYKTEMSAKGFEVFLMASPKSVAAHANLIVTATPSKEPLLAKDDIQPGTHITAMGSDTIEKQELDSAILAQADIVVADSLSQCRERGEIFKAIGNNHISMEAVLELGTILDNPRAISRGENDITISDLTGVAVQDIQIATAVCNAFELEPNR
jgi:ornithine cyclodeaminase